LGSEFKFFDFDIFVNVLPFWYEKQVYFDLFGNIKKTNSIIAVNSGIRFLIILFIFFLVFHLYPEGIFSNKFKNPIEGKFNRCKIRMDILLKQFEKLLEKRRKINLDLIFLNKQMQKEIKKNEKKQWKLICDIAKIIERKD